MATGKSVDSYNVAAIEQRMQRMSADAAKRLGETQKKAPEKKPTAKKKGT